MVALLRWVLYSVPGRMLLELWVICFVKKSTSTIKTGAGSMGMFCSWRVAKFPGQSVVPSKNLGCTTTGACAGTLDDQRLHWTLYIVPSATLRVSLARSEQKLHSNSLYIAGAAHAMLLNWAPRRRAEALTLSCSACRI